MRRLIQAKFWVSKVTLVSILLGTASSIAQQSRESDLFEARTTRLQATTMHYRLFKPRNYDPAKKYPVVVALHGVGERGTDNRRQVDLEDLAHPWIEDTVQAKVPHFIMIPQCPTDSTWGGMGGASGMGSTGQGILNILDSMKREFSVDTNRFYIAGLSMGAAGTYNLLRGKPGYFAAAAPCAAGGATASVSAIAQTPIWHHHGANDGTGGRNMATALEGAGHKVVRFVSQTVLPAPSLTAYRDAIRAGRSRESLLSSNSNITWDSLTRAARGGAKYLYSELTGGDHRSGWMIAWHNPLLAEWMFSKVKGGNVVSIVPMPKKGQAIQQSATLVLTRLNAAAGGASYSLTGRRLTERNPDVKSRPQAQMVVLQVR
jgi:poly(3-hydroxybutyrate) depolymerase